MGSWSNDQLTQLAIDAVQAKDDHTTGEPDPAALPHIDRDISSRDSRSPTPSSTLLPAPPPEPRPTLAISSTAEDSLSHLIRRFHAETIDDLDENEPSLRSAFATLHEQHSIACAPLKATHKLPIPGDTIWLQIECTECKGWQAAIAHPISSYNQFNKQPHMKEKRHEKAVQDYLNLFAPSVKKRVRSISPEDERSRSVRPRNVLAGTTAPLPSSSPPPTPLVERKLDHSQPPDLARYMDWLRSRYDLVKDDLENAERMRDLLTGLQVDDSPAEVEDEPELVAGSRMKKKRVKRAPPMSALANGGPVRKVDEALRILGLTLDTSNGKWGSLSGMNEALSPAQVTAVASIWKMMDESPHRGFMLCDAVGMGKTLSALSVFVKDEQDTGKVRPTVIFCPVDLQMTVWHAEITKWMPKLVPMTRFVRQLEDWNQVLLEREMDSEAAPIVIINFDFVQNNTGRKAEDPLKSVKLEQYSAYRVIVDECQQLRNTRLRPARFIPPYCNSPSVKHVLLLSGTIAPEDASDVYTPLKMLGKHTMSYGNWVKKIPSDYLSSTNWLRDVLQDSTLYMARSFDDAVSLLTDIDVNEERSRKLVCKPGPAEGGLLRSLRRRLSMAIGRDLDRIETDMKRGKHNKDIGLQPLDNLVEESSPIHTILEALRLATYSVDALETWAANVVFELNHLEKAEIIRIRKTAYRGLSAKMNELVSKIEKTHGDPAHAGDKILIVGRDDRFLEPLQRALANQGYREGGAPSSSPSPSPVWLSYHAGISTRSEKDAIIEQLESDPRVQILMGPMLPLSEGKNLQMCNHLYLLDVPPSPGTRIQLEGRVLRPGQRKSVTIYRFLTLGSLDPHLDMLVTTRSTSVGIDERMSLTYGFLKKSLEQTA